MAPLMRWVNAVLALVYPECCQICRKARATPAEGFVCAGCRQDVRFIEAPFCRRCGMPFQGQINQEFECSNCLDVVWHFEYARAAVHAKGVVLDVIHRYKYTRQLWFEPFLAGLLSSVACGTSPFGMKSRPGSGATPAPALISEVDWDLLIPVPLHPVKEREREFNQAVRLARRLCRVSGIPTDCKVLRRVIQTRTQTHLSREERLQNVRNAFELRKGADLSGKRVILIDDVLTTGATTNACAEVLRGGGASKVCVWTVARRT